MISATHIDLLMSIIINILITLSIKSALISLEQKGKFENELIFISYEFVNT